MARRLRQDLRALLPDRACSVAVTPMPSGRRLGQALRPRRQQRAATTRTAHVGKGARSAHRPRRPRATSGTASPSSTRAVPRAVWWAIGITHVWALIMWILLPTWPLVTTYTQGLLGVDQQRAGRRAARSGAASRARIGRRAIAADADRRDPRRPGADADRGPKPRRRSSATTAPPATARTPPAARASRASSTTTGSGAATADAILETLRVGDQRHPSRDARLADAGLRPRRHPDARPDPHGGRLRPIALGRARPPEDARAAGRDDLRRQLRQLPRRGRAPATPSSARLNLTDAIWIYGGDEAPLFETIYGGRQGWMPRLGGPAERWPSARCSTIYISTGRGEA